MKLKSFLLGKSSALALLPTDHGKSFTFQLLPSATVLDFLTKGDVRQMKTDSPPFL